MSDVLRDKDKGTSKIHNVGFDDAWEIATTVLRWEDCEAIEQHPNSGYMLTTVGVDLVSSGTFVGVWVESIDENKSNITVVTKRKMQTELFTGLTETTFHERFKQAVDIVKAGNKLPFDAP
jgi:hypothetical protein